MTTTDTIAASMAVIGVGTLVQGWFTYRQGQTIQKIHVLVNQRLGEALRGVWTGAQDKADNSGNQQDIVAAAVAKKQYDDHQTQQAIVDKTSSTTQP